MNYKRLALAITFSPTGKALLAEAVKLQEKLNSELVLIHVGEKNNEAENKLREMISVAGADTDKTRLVWKKGDPARSILDVEKEEEIGLLIAGALEKENLIGYYIGSVARKLMRRSVCSVLILSKPSEEKERYGNIVIAADYTSAGEKMVRDTIDFASAAGFEKATILKEYSVPGLALTVTDSGSIREAENKRAHWQQEEEEKLKMFVKELNFKLDKPEIDTRVEFGKPGWAAAKYAKSSDASLLAVSHPKRVSRFFDRLFTHDFEFQVKELPSSLLIVK